MSCPSSIRRDLPFLPRRPDSNDASNRRVLNEPYDTVPFNCCCDATAGDRKFTDPPNVDGPIVDADPGLRSNTVDPIVCAGKNTHEWCVGSLVSLNGIPSNVMLYWPSLKPR